MTNNKQQTAVDSIIEFCQKQMDNDSSIHKGVYLSIIKFCKEQAKEMQKERMIEFAKKFIDVVNIEDKDIENIYNETYGGNK
jgi:hypothetical protein